MSAGGVRESDVLKADSTAPNAVAAAPLTIGVVLPRNIEYVKKNKRTKFELNSLMNLYALF